jgi:hypothetical protein
VLEKHNVSKKNQFTSRNPNWLEKCSSVSTKDPKLWDRNSTGSVKGNTEASYTNYWKIFCLFGFSLI